MKQSRRIGKEPSLLKILFVSVILHLIFISLAVVPIKIKNRDFSSYTVKLVGPIEPFHKKIAADSASKLPPAPKKTGKAVEKAPKETALKPAPKPAPKADITLEEVERVSKEIERLRAISKLAKKLEQGKKEKKKQQLREIRIAAKEALEKPVEVTGAQTESAGENTGNEDDNYGNIIQQAIQQQWAYSGFKTSGLSATVAIKIGRDGKITVQDIEKSSGDTLFDRSVIKAVLNASPLPPPPGGEIEIGLVFAP
jgi:colicin import membrane protein